MVVFKDLKSLMDIVMKWENDLKDFYDVAEIALKRNRKSMAIVSLLKEDHISNFNIIKDIRVENFGKDEWIKYVPDHRAKDLIPIRKINKGSTPKEILTHILDYEEKIRDFYSSISKKIITRDEKELFDSLVKFKDRQILIIKKNMDYI